MQMLRINRLRIEINTENGVYGLDEVFHDGLNFISSHENTCGKSSILAAIYYCLGLEQIIGGVGGIGSKVLTSAFKSSIDDNGNSWVVLESGVYLEITNGSEVVTIFRNIKHTTLDNRLVTVFYGKYEDINELKIQSEDFYVNITSGATSKKGFHSFLEDFLYLNLPIVRTSDGNERKLYLQIIFSAMFIEQKHGWSDILSGMPIFGIRESKRRVVEFLLALDTFRNEREHDRLNSERVQIEHDWEQLIQRMQDVVSNANCVVVNHPRYPHIIEDKEFSRLTITTYEGIEITERIDQLKKENSNLRQLKPKVLENFDAINRELSDTETLICTLEKDLSSIVANLAKSDQAILKLTTNLEILDADICNNLDAARLQKFGSEATESYFSANICPTCKQNIHDNLLSTSIESEFMSIDENIRHLKEQKKMLLFSLDSREKKRNDLLLDKQQVEIRLQKLRKLAFILRSDLYTTTDTEASESVVLKKIELSSRIEQLENLQIEILSMIENLQALSKRWSKYLEQKSKLPNKEFSELDEEKIKSLKLYFINNLKSYHYSSLSNFEGIDIPKESLLPTIDGFDMKFDSSASDGIRVIWAFTMALLQVSIEKKGNHPCIIIFDEPAQQSIIPEDMRSFIFSAIKLSKNTQIITAITLNSHELIDIMNELPKDSYHEISIPEKAFKLLLR